jgi:tetratricopeptide (TPR) repeat protein
MAPETIRGRSTPASDVYSMGLVMYQLFTGGGPHLTAPWAIDDKKDTSAENYRIKTALEFAPPSAFQNEIRNDYRWLDDVILNCLESDPGRRFADAVRLLEAIERCEAGDWERAVPPPSRSAEHPDAEAREKPVPKLNDEAAEALFREVRKLLAGRAYDQVIDRLDVYRPAEWAVVDVLGARTLRALGQAYLGRGEPAQARECLEQLRTCQREQGLLTRTDYAAALTDLFRCYRALGMDDLARACQEEAKQQL